MKPSTKFLPLAQGLSWQEALQTGRQAGEEVIATWCGMCGPVNNCALYAFVKDGRFRRVAGMREAPQNRGGLCCKAHAAPEWVYSPERLTQPLRRVGRRGEGRFEPISWEDAIGIVGDCLLELKDRYGPESLAILSPARRDYSEYLFRFLQVHGSPHYAHSAICALQLDFALSHTIGTRPFPDYAQAEVILIWGRQPVYSGPPLEDVRALMAARERGARIYAIKPSMEADMALATDWVPIRPGTDAALALSLLHVVMEEQHIDQAFVREWCYGYDQLADHVRQYSPAWAETITGIPAKQIVEIARLYATTPRAVIDYGNGLEHAPSASDAIRAIGSLMAITGHLDRPGGNVFRKPPVIGPRPLGLRERYTPAWLDRLVGEEFPKAFQPYKEGITSAYGRMFADICSLQPTIRALIAPGTQPLVSTRNPRGVVAALEKVDFFVVADTTRTAEMPWADMVLPALTPYEMETSFRMRGPFLMARRKVIEPVGEGRSMQQIIFDLAVAMGYGDDFWQGDLSCCLNWQLEPLGLTLEELDSYPHGKLYDTGKAEYEKYASVFQTASPRLDKAPLLAQGKVSLYNTRFAKAGYAPLPSWREPPESLTATPDLTQMYPLLLSDYHTSRSFSAGWQRHVPALRNIEPYPQLHIHPLTAQKYGIDEGMLVEVESPHGRIRVRAQQYPGIRQDTVMVLHGWWQGCKEHGLEDFPLFDGGANVNVLYSPDLDALSDPLITAMGSQTLVRVRPVEEDKLHEK